MPFTLAEAVIKIFIPKEEVKKDLKEVEQAAAESAESTAKGFKKGFQQAEEASARFAKGTRGGIRDVRQAVGGFSTALSATSRILRATGDEGARFANQLDSGIIVISTATGALGAFRGVVASLPIVLAAARTAMTAFLGPIGIAVTLLTVLAGVLIIYKRRQDEARQATERAKAAEEERTGAFGRFIKVLTFQGEVGRRTTQQQIEDLQRLRDRYAKTADERMEIDRRIFQLREQLRKEDEDREKKALTETQRRTQAALELSMDFIQRLIAREAPTEQVVAAFQRVIERVKGLRAEDLGDAEDKAVLLKRLANELADFEFRTRKEARDKSVALQKETRDKIVALQKDVRNQIEALTLGEFEVKRRAIQREFEERRKAILEAMRLGLASVKDLEAADRARSHAFRRLLKEELDEAQAIRKRIADLDLRLAQTRARLRGRPEEEVAVIRTRALADATKNLSLSDQTRLESAQELQDLLGQRLAALQQEIEAAKEQIRLAEETGDPWLLVAAREKQRRAEGELADVKAKLNDALRVEIDLLEKLKAKEQEAFDAMAKASEAAGIRIDAAIGTGLTTKIVKSWQDAVAEILRLQSTMPAVPGTPLPGGGLPSGAGVGIRSGGGIVIQVGGVTLEATGQDRRTALGFLRVILKDPDARRIVEQELARGNL